LHNFPYRHLRSSIPEILRDSAFITEMVKAGKNLKVVADYCGTSVAMIEVGYVGLLSLNLDQTVLQLVPRKYLESLVAGPGFEPGTSRL
jgi:hypothetical protein